MNAQLDTHVEGEIVAAARNAIAEFDPFEAQLTEFRERYETVVYDLNDEQQNKQARSDKHTIGKVIARLDRQHKSVKEPLLEATRLLDGRRKEIKDGLLDVQGRIKSQIDEHEAKEKARIDGHFERIEAIRAWGEGLEDRPAQYIADTLQEVTAISLDGYEEFKADAALAKSETIEAIEKLLAAREKYEAEQAELERLRAEKEARERADREAKIAAEAAEKAKCEAERAAQAERERIERAAQEERETAERARIQAEENAKREVAEANARAERAAEEERARIEAARVKAEREAAAKQAEEDARKAKQQHRAKIHKAAKESLMTAGGLDDELATHIVELIKDGAIRNVQIVY